MTPGLQGELLNHYAMESSSQAGTVMLLTINLWVVDHFLLNLVQNRCTSSM